MECTEDDLRILFAKFVSAFAEGVRVCVYVRMCVCLCKDGLPSYKMHVVYFPEGSMPLFLGTVFNC